MEGPETITAPEHELYIQAAAMLAERISACKDRCVIAMAGGRSIPALLDHLLPYAHEFRAPITIFWADERISAEKNYAAALPYLERLRHAGVSIEWHPLQSTNVQTMEVEMHQVFALIGRESPHFDIVILSAGEDGHIASLFPHHLHLKARHAGYVIEERSPKPPEQRVTMTPALLCSTRSALLFFIKKHDAYTLFTDPQATPEDCPAKLLLDIGRLTVFVSLH